MNADNPKETTKKKFLPPDAVSASLSRKHSLQPSPLALQEELAKLLSSSGH